MAITRKHKHKDGKNIYKKTFILSLREDGIEYNPAPLRDYLKSIGLIETHDPSAKTMYLHMQHMKNKTYNYKYYKTQCYLINILSDGHKAITNKANLYTNFAATFPAECRQYMAATWDLSSFDVSKLENPANVFIIRPAGRGAFSGNDIYVINSVKEYYRVKAILEKKTYNNVIISEYVTNIMLWTGGYKFHLRVYLLASIIEGVYKTWLYDFCEVFTAEKPYRKSDWSNKDIHDTHFSSVGKYVMGPYDFTSEMKAIYKDKIYPKIADCMGYVSQLYKDKCKPYENAVNAFEVFGCDILVRDNYDIVLMEINDHTGISMASFPDRREEFSRIYFSQINDFILNPTFKGVPPSREPLYSSIRGIVGGGVSSVSPKRIVSQKRRISVSSDNDLGYWLKLGYPYAKLFVNPHHLFSQIKQYTNHGLSYERFAYLYSRDEPSIKDHRFGGKYVSIMIPMRDSNHLDAAVDYYTEESRIKCTLKNRPSVYDLATKRNLLEYTLKSLIRRKKSITFESYRDELYKFPHIYYCSGESVLFYRSLYLQLFPQHQRKKMGGSGGITVLDGAMGYGQRLMAAMSAGYRYIGIDPNTETIAGCHHLIRDLVPSDKQNRYKIYAEGLPASAGIAAVPAHSVDIAIFSPPSFDEEIYSDDTQQSILLFLMFDDWLEKFLHPSLDILVSKVSGYLVIQSRKIKYIHSYLLAKKNVKFAGVIARKTYGGLYKPNHIYRVTPLL